MTNEQVRKLPPFERLLYWIREREQIRLKRQAGLPPPWSDDPIFQQYRFCNVVRIQDKVSQWLLHNWYEPNIDHPNMVLACTMARQFNNPGTLDDLGFPYEWQPEEWLRLLREREKAGLTNYNGAYVISNMGRKDPKIELTINVTCRWMVEETLLINTDSMRRTWECLCNAPGVGSFIAGQIVADLRWAMNGPWSDRMEWAPSGPGSIRGLLRLDGKYDPNKPKPSMSGRMFQQRFEVWLRKMLIQKRIPNMEAMDFQNCLCEFDKYERCLWGEGEPKQRFRGTGKERTIARRMK